MRQKGLSAICRFKGLNHETCFSAKVYDDGEPVDLGIGCVFGHNDFVAGCEYAADGLSAATTTTAAA